MDFLYEYINITLYKNKPPLYEEKTYTVGDNNIAFKIFFTYDYGLPSLLGKTFQIQYVLPNNGLYIDEFLIQTNSMCIERKIDNRCFLNSGEIFVKFALKDDLNNSYIQIPHNIKIKINPSFITSEYTPASVQEIMVEKMVDKAIIKVQDFIDKDLNNLIKETINNNYSLNNIVEETHNTLSTFMNKINDKLNFSEDFIIKNNKIYLNKQEKYEYENIYINYIEKIQSDHLIKTEEGHVYEQISDNLYIHYNINTKRPYDDTLLQDLHNFAIDYYKNKAYFILEEEKRKLLEQCLTVYFFGIGNPDICNQTKLLNWYRQQEEKITSYNDLSTEIIINKF